MFEEMTSVQQFVAGVAAGLVAGILLTIIYTYHKYGPEGVKFILFLWISCTVFVIGVSLVGHEFYPDHWLIKGVDDLILKAFEIIENSSH